MSGIISAHTELDYQAKVLEHDQFRQQRLLARQGRPYRPRRIYPSAQVSLAIKSAALFLLLRLAIGGGMQ